MNKAQITAFVDGTDWEPTEEQIEELASEAEASGDRQTVQLCSRALSSESEYFRILALFSIQDELVRRARAEGLL